MADIQYVSKEKLEALKVELQSLIEVDMPATAVRIDEARQMGDLSENAEYHAAREQLGWQKARSLEVQAVIDNAQIITGGKSDTVSLGSSVTVRVKGKEKTYMLVGAQEADPLAGKISNESPLGEAFFGKRKGDTVEVEIPAGKQEYEILNIS
jgi:transcription elongation factor GreA